MDGCGLRSWVIYRARKKGRMLSQKDGKGRGVIRRFVYSLCIIGRYSENAVARPKIASDHSLHTMPHKLQAFRDFTIRPLPYDLPKK